MKHGGTGGWRARRACLVLGVGLATALAGCSGFRQPPLQDRPVAQIRRAGTVVGVKVLEAPMAGGLRLGTAQGSEAALASSSGAADTPATGQRAAALPAAAGLSAEILIRLDDGELRVLRVAPAALPAALPVVGDAVELVTDGGVLRLERR